MFTKRIILQSTLYCANESYVNLNIFLELKQFGHVKESVYQGKNGRTERSKRKKTVPEKVATTRAEDGHKSNTKTSTII
jgi:hypothetical protein